jgi:3-oxoacyl-[acyl-carrier-protein] synthase-1
MCNGLGATTADVLDALSAGRSSLAPPPLDLPFETVCGAVRDPLPALPAAFAHGDSRITRLAALGLADVRGALAAATRRWGSDRVGAVLGTSTGGLAHTEAAFAERARTGSMPAWFDFEQQHPFHVVVDIVCAMNGIDGARYAVSTACSSSAKVFGAAARLLSAGVCDAVLVGGVDTLCQTTIRGFQALSVLSPVACRPFGQDRRGINVGEGAAFALLERAADTDAAVRFLGIGESCDAHHMSAPDPEGRGARLAMREALARAGLAAADVDYVNAHGTGTVKSDGAEAIAIAEVFGDRVWVASTKGYTGHLLGAGGATEALFSVASIERGFVPSSLGAVPLDGSLAIRVATARVDMPVRAAVSNSLAFGGNNACLAFGRGD